MEEKEYSVSEAVQLIGAPSHVLRYWEEELQLPVKRTGQGHRIYTEQDVMTFRRVRELKENGIQLKAIRVLLHGEEQTILGETQSLAEKILEVERRTAGCEAGKTLEVERRTAGCEAGKILEVERRTAICEAGKNPETKLLSADGEERMNCEPDGAPVDGGCSRADPDSRTASGTESVRASKEAAVGSDSDGRTASEAESGQVSEGETIRADSDGRTVNRTAGGQASEEETADIADQYEIVLKEKREHLRQFEEILKGLMEQVIEEQNKKLEQTISDIIRREIEDLYLQYYGEIAREAAATRNREPSTRGILTWLRSLFCGKR